MQVLLCSQHMPSVFTPPHVDLQSNQPSPVPSFSSRSTCSYTSHDLMLFLSTAISKNLVQLFECLSLRLRYKHVGPYHSEETEDSEHHKNSEASSLDHRWCGDTLVD